MFNFFWSRNASVGMAVVYIVLGLPLLLFPAAVGTVFVWALAIGCLVYAVPHFVRYLQGRKVGQAFGGDLFLSVLPLLFALFALLRPHVILSFLPFVLGALLLLDGVGKLPVMLDAIQTHAPGMAYGVASTLVPLILGIVLLINPFQAAQMVIQFFGLGLILDGVADFIAARSIR
ncbi:DUF308 domain-containing protein [Pseudoflavonifractor sp. An85]|uniref:HdeD family acid-resistance protein n=1 Tax=Pseudoflavonifractor sp. An85 TaxID=1965661 RepID=UPI000B378706|nr:DUF308 domain-containing protein [Pseudoflavonifractor sp. An85]OUN23498.1 hypothetical protein B5G37_08520 [Pseudoflavonifractor sp. An85]